jgi:hypothetical protein
MSAVLPKRESTLFPADMPTKVTQLLQVDNHAEWRAQVAIPAFAQPHLGSPG